MDPISLGIGAIGLGLKLWGGMSASSDAKQIANVSSQNAALEGRVNDQRREQMELSARRQQLEDFRNNQRARAFGINAAVNQGAQMGTGLQGGLAEIQDQGLFNVQGVNQNLEIGRNIFGLNGQISQNNSKIAQLKGQEASDEGWSSLGGSLLQSSGTIGNIAKSRNSIGNFFFGGGSPSGYGA